MARRTVLWSCCLILSASINQAVVGQEIEPAIKKIQRYALLISADDYAPPLNKLEYCYNDMTDLRARLEIAGFAPQNITLMSDHEKEARLRPTKANIESELALRLQLANVDDVVVIAFSGHGVHIDGNSYLCPTDAHLDGTTSLIPIDTIYAQMKKCAAGEKVLIVDACRNEPIVRGFKSGKLADDLALKMQAPPSGIVVLSSCEPGQFSAEDPRLKHGVFMNYIIEGLEGPADTDIDIGGNKNGKISLHELYFYAHEKTKLHVAQSHGIVQRPELNGKMVGRFDIAMVPEESQLRTVVRRPKKEILDEKSAEGETLPAKVQVEPVKSFDYPLLRQADDYLRRAEHDNAIQAYSAVLEDQTLDGGILKEARKGRGAAYLARGGKADLDKALIDQLAAGLPGIQLTVRAATADLQVESTSKGKVRQNQTVVVSKIIGDWLWVTSVDGSDKVKGFIQRSALVQQPAPPPAPAPVVASPQPSVHQQYNPNQYDDDDYNPRQSNMRQMQNQRPQRPPSIWETPEWESPAEIRRGRANGTLR